MSSDMRLLLASETPQAKDAIELFVFRIVREICALSASLGGLDGIVFTAGIGEHQPQIRAAVCRHLAWLGVAIDATANSQNAMRIEAAPSKVAVLVVPTDEEQVIADQTRMVLDAT